MAFLLDIDGTLFDAGKPIDGSSEAVAALRERGPVVFATNTTRKPRREIADSLNAAGIGCDADEVWCAGRVVAEYLEAHDLKRISLLLPDTCREDFDGFELTDESVQAVVIGDLGAGFTFDVLNDAFRQLRNGAVLVGIHKNRYWKSESGWTLDVGAFVSALEYSAATQAVILGKPSLEYFTRVAQALHAAPSSLTIVGDDLEADIGGGRAHGLRTVLVRTGKFSEDDLRSADDTLRPHHIVDSIRDVPLLVRSLS